MNTWLMQVCIAASNWGCGMSHNIPFPSEESCYRALREMRMNDQPVAESNQKRTAVAYCYPAKVTIK
jgi:hypothetical protein